MSKKQEWLKGWKVIKENRTSAVRDLKKLCIYPVGVITKRPFGCGPLAVFTNKEDAEDFRACMSTAYQPRKVVKCVYKQSKDKDLWQRHSLNEFWSKNTLPYQCLPTGTDVADKVKCLE